MKRYSFSQLLIVCTGIIFLFGSFTSMFEETPFMKGVMDNPGNTTECTLNSPTKVGTSNKLSNILANTQFSNWKSILLLSIKNVEKERITKEKIIREKQANLMNILKTCNQELTRYSKMDGSSNLSEKITDANWKLEEGMKLLQQIQELQTDFHNTTIN